MCNNKNNKNFFLNKILFLMIGIAVLSCSQSRKKDVVNFAKKTKMIIKKDQMIGIEPLSYAMR